MGLIKKLFGTTSEKELKRITPLVDKIEALADQYRALSDSQLRAKTAEFRARLGKGETLDDLLPEAFATVREAATRVIGQTPFRVQLIGGIVLHQGRIAEMKTGEGKTLVATLPAYLNALAGKGVHIVTVNDYLVTYQSEWMGKIYRFLGMTVGIAIHGMEPAAKKAAYACDITYGTNNEMGFDYLRDNMAIYKENVVQRGHDFAIVDEVDSILVDEARTPLIISGQGEKSTVLYDAADRFASGLKCVTVLETNAKEDNDEELGGDYVVDEKARTVTLLPAGVQKAEKHFKVENLSDSENLELLHHINQAIKARGIMKRDTDYVVKDGEVIIVDEFTGRLMFGRRYSEGLHQAIEAKERVTVEHESKTLATITFQNYFRLYRKLSGMTGTAATEEDEFREIYKLDVVEIPTNRPVIRKDHPDVVYKNLTGKWRGVIDCIAECHEKGQPVLVGTVSVEKSENLSKLLKQRGIKHEVLNAKYHDKEAEIVAQAGHVGAVTIATNMAGRGTDIMLGGNAEYLAKSEMKKRGIEETLIAEASGFSETDDQDILDTRALYRELYGKYKADIAAEADKVRAAGGLFILGTERHDSRRIDNQLRGRSGRQGDPGESRFFISMEDDLMRIFGNDRMTGIANALRMDEDVPIEAKMLSNAIETAQRRVEARNFDSRKHVLQYDDVMNMQRGIIYEQRRQVLDGKDLKQSILKMMDDWIVDAVSQHCRGDIADDWDLAGLGAATLGILTKENELKYTREQLEHLTTDDLVDRLTQNGRAMYERKEQEFGQDNMRELERVVMLRTVDTKWMDHIDAMHELRHGIALRAYAQRDPVMEYRSEGFDMFEAMIASIKEDTVRLIASARLRKEEPIKRTQVARPVEESRGDGTVKKAPVRRAAEKVGRNDPCPCGSGKKYKKCCGQ